MEKEKKEKKEKIRCFHCGKAYIDTNYYNSNSVIYKNTGKLPYCKQCIERLYQYYFKKYADEGYSYPERKAVKRLCMAFDIFYKDDVFNSSLRNYRDSDVSTSPMSQYMRCIQLIQYNRNKETYDTTLEKECEHDATNALKVNTESDFEPDKDTIDFFGAGFNNEDYEFLYREYGDWIARHECKTKAQEEVFKRLCFKQLEILKATRKGEDTKDLDATFQKLLDTAKLQPKQNSGDAMADNQTFGTLIDKFENERPLPEIDEELRDVDKIGYYIDAFFKGHTCKMLNVRNAFSNLYSSMMKKFTVKKPEYNLDEDDYDSEINFDAIFGDKTSDLSEE